MSLNCQNNKKGMRNPFLHYQAYSFVKDFKKIEQKRSSGKQGARTDRVKSHDNVPSSLINEIKPYNQTPNYLKHMDNLKKIQAESAKIYGLDVLRYEPQGQIFGMEEYCQQKRKKEKSKSKINYYQLQDTNPPLNDQRSSFFNNDFESECNINRKKKRLSPMNKKQSMLTSMLNINFKDTQNQNYGYDSEDQSYPDVVVKGRFSKEGKMKSSIMKTSKQSAYNFPYKAATNYEIMEEDEKTSCDLNKSLKSKTQKSFRSGKSIKSIKKSFKTIIKSQNQVRLTSSKTISKKSIDRAPQIMKFRGKKFYFFQKSVLRC